MMAARTRRALSLILAMIMCLSLVNISALAIGESSGTVEYQKEDWTYSADGKVAHKKTIEKTGENKFDITLSVKTMEEIHEQSVSPDAAVVLVMDVSNSMKETVDGKQPDRESDQRIYKAKAAAQKFIDSFAADAEGAERKVAIVEFGSSAYTVQGWTDPATAKNAVNNVGINFEYPACTIAETHTHDVNTIEWSGFLGLQWRCSVEGCEYYVEDSFWGGLAWHTLFERGYDGHVHTMTYEGPHGDIMTDGGGTNIEGGLQLADNLLSSSEVADIGNCYVVLITDGVPTYHLYGNRDHSSMTFLEGQQGGGSYAARPDYEDVPSVAGSVKSKATLYTVSYASGRVTETVGGYRIDAWLSSFANKNIAANDDIDWGLGKVTEIIQNQSQAWILTDPIPAENYIVFNTEDNANIPDMAVNPDAIFGYDSAENELVWDLKGDVYDRIERDGNVTWYIYEETYTIRLNTAGTGFIADHAYETNGTTTLTYMVTENGELQSDLKETYLVVPKVSGKLPMTEYTVQYEWAANSAKPDSVALPEDVTISEANAKSYTMGTLPDGVEGYTVIEGWYADQNAAGSQYTGTCDLTVLDPDGDHVVTLYAYCQKLGSLTVTKEFTGLPSEMTVPADFTATLTLTDTVRGTEYTACYDNGTFTFDSIAYSTYAVKESVTAGESFSGVKDNKTGTYSFEDFVVVGSEQRQITVGSDAATAQITNEYKFTASDEVTITYTWMPDYGWPADAESPDPLASVVDPVDVSDLASYTLHAAPNLEELDPLYYSLEYADAAKGIVWYVKNADDTYSAVNLDDDIKTLQGGESITLYAKLACENTYTYRVIYDYYYRDNAAESPTWEKQYSSEAAEVEINRAASITLKDIYDNVPTADKSQEYSGKTYVLPAYAEGVVTLETPAATWESGNRTYRVRLECEEYTSGTLTVTKTVEGLSDTALAELESELTFTVKDANSNVVTTFKLSEMTKQTDGSYSKVISGLSLNTEYTVTESGHDDVTGYTWQTSDTSKTATFTAKDGVKTLAFANTYTGKSYTVIFDATELGAVSDTIETTAGIYTWTYRYDDSTNAWFWDKSTGEASTVKVPARQQVFKFTQAGLEAGLTALDVPNVTYDTDKYTWINNAFYLVDGDTVTETAYASLTEAMALMAQNDVTTLTFRATYTRDTGSLKIEKTVTGLTVDSENPVTNTYLFKVVGPDGNQVTNAEREDGFYAITVTDNGSNSITINNLPTGSYTVTEQTGEDYYIDGYSNINTSDDISKTVTVSKGSTITAAITNTYVEAEGAGSFILTFDKALIGDEEGETYSMDAVQFEFLVEENSGVSALSVGLLSAGETEWTGTTDSEGHVRIKIPFQTDLSELDVTEEWPMTFRYTLSEVEGSIPGMAYDDGVYSIDVTITWTFKDGAWTYQVTKVDATLDNSAGAGREISEDGKTVMLTSPSEDEPAAFTNVWTQVDVTVRKEFTGVTALPENFAIEIRNGTTLVDTLTLDEGTLAGGYYTWNIELPALADGETYTFTETGYAVSGMTHSLTYQYRYYDSSWHWTNTLTGANGSFTMPLAASSYLNAETDGGLYTLAVAEAAEIRLTNTYTSTGGGTIILPPDTNPTPDPEPEEEIEEDDVPLTDLPEEETAEDIEEDDVPLTDLPEEDISEEDISEEDVPLAEAPKTGDSMGMWIAAAGVSGLGLVWIALTGRKRRDEEN